MNGPERFLRQCCVNLVHVLGLGNGFLGDQVYQVKQRLRGRSIVPKIDLSRMHSTIPNYTHYIQRLLNSYIETSGDERPNV